MSQTETELADRRLVLSLQMLWCMHEFLWKAAKLEEKLSATSDAITQATTDLKAAEVRIIDKIGELNTALANAQVEDPAVTQAVTDLQAEVSSIGSIVPAS